MIITLTFGRPEVPRFKAALETPAETTVSSAIEGTELGVILWGDGTMVCVGTRFPQV
jgi:hypothetical protein